MLMVGGLVAESVWLRLGASTGPRAKLMGSICERRPREVSRVVPVPLFPDE